MEKVEEGITIAGKGAEGDVRGSFSTYADLTERALHVQKTIIRKSKSETAFVMEYTSKSDEDLFRATTPMKRVIKVSPYDFDV